MVGDNNFYFRVFLHHTNEGGRSGVRISVRSRVDFLVDNLNALLLKSINNTNGTLTTITALSLKTPDKYGVARLQACTFGGLGTEREAGFVC